MSGWTSAFRTLLILVLLAQSTAALANQWEKFKRIRQGQATLEEEAREVPQETKEQAEKTPPVVEPEPARPKATTRKPAPVRKPVTASENIRISKNPQVRGEGWAFFRGNLSAGADGRFGPYSDGYAWAYSRVDRLPKHARIMLYLHDVDAADHALWDFPPARCCDIEVRLQDAEVHGEKRREWWAFDALGMTLASRRIVALLDFLHDRYDLNVARRGIVLDGPGMGGGGAVLQSMLLPDRWREKIAYVSGRAGNVMLRSHWQVQKSRYASLPPDAPAYREIWNAVSFHRRVADDSILRNLHFRHVFSSDDPFAEGPRGNAQLEFVNLVERHKIGGAFSWVKGGHAVVEPGIDIPDLSEFEHSDQDVSLDRAHPAFTRSTGNFPRGRNDRLNVGTYPRGHYNLGLIWDHDAIVDEPDQLVFPIRYEHRERLGAGVPDQPQSITVSVTPRRAKKFMAKAGEEVLWVWGEGELTGSVQVVGETFTVDKLPLVSGESYKKLRFHRP